MPSPGGLISLRTRSPSRRSSSVSNMPMAIARPPSGSTRSVKPTEGTPSGGPEAARDWISCADRRIASASPPSHLATRAYMSRGSFRFGAPTLLPRRPRVVELQLDFFLPPPLFLPPLDDALGVLAIFAARSLLMPFLRRPSYCLSSLTLGPWSLVMSASSDRCLEGTVPGPAGENTSSVRADAQRPGRAERRVRAGQRASA